MLLGAYLETSFYYQRDALQVLRAAGACRPATEPVLLLYVAYMMPEKE
jgi:hypothetical protein